MQENTLIDSLRKMDNIYNYSTEFITKTSNAHYVLDAEVVQNSVVAAGLTGDSTSIPKEALDWLNKKPGLFGKKLKIETEHASMARQCVQKIIDNSELKELWSETEDFAKWLTIQKNLIAKLSNV